MKFPLMNDSLWEESEAAALSEAATTQVYTERLVPTKARGAFIALTVACLALLSGYLALGGLGLFFVGFVGIVASTARLLAAHILAALT